MPTFVVVRLYKHAAVGDWVQDEAPVVRTLGVGGCVGLMDSELPVRGHGQIQVLLTVETKRAEFLAVLSVLECVFSLAEYILKNKKKQSNEDNDSTLKTILNYIQNDSSFICNS